MTIKDMTEERPRPVFLHEQAEKFLNLVKTSKGNLSSVELAKYWENSFKHLRGLFLQELALSNKRALLLSWLLNPPCNPRRDIAQEQGLEKRFEKLKEEVFEFLEAFELRGMYERLTEEQRAENEVHILEEAGDMFEVLLTIAEICPDLLHVADSKMLRTQIRGKNGAYDVK